MRWQDERRSSNVEDRRGFPVRGAGVVGGGAIVVALIATLLGAPPSFVRAILGGGGDEQTQQQTRPIDPADNERVDFVKAVLGSTEDVWTAVLPKSGQEYVPPKLVLFSDEVESACGLAGAAVGPFYCPPDKKVYLDLSFLRMLSQRFGAPGDFAQAYVIGHEVGHHVQNLLGITERTEQARAAAGSRAASNRVSVETELQADCLAGVWAFHANQTHHMLEPGDVEGAMTAAAAIGDDALQRRAQGRVVPDSFTHGTSAQRTHWLKVGLERGRVADCDTFNADSLGAR
jgi:predicted metalloprotease